MKFLYAIKGCSHCDIREGCELKNHPANLDDIPRIIDRWWTKCKDFMRMDRRY